MGVGRASRSPRRLWQRRKGVPAVSFHPRTLRAGDQVGRNSTDRFAIIDAMAVPCSERSDVRCPVADASHATRWAARIHASRRIGVRVRWTQDAGHVSRDQRPVRGSGGVEGRDRSPIEGSARRREHPWNFARVAKGANAGPTCRRGCLRGSRLADASACGSIKGVRSPSSTRTVTGIAGSANAPRASIPWKRESANRLREAVLRAVRRRQSDASMLGIALTLFKFSMIEGVEDAGLWFSIVGERRAPAARPVRATVSGVSRSDSWSGRPAFLSPPMLCRGFKRRFR